MTALRDAIAAKLALSRHVLGRPLPVPDATDRSRAGELLALPEMQAAHAAQDRYQMHISELTQRYSRVLAEVERLRAQKATALELLAQYYGDNDVRNALTAGDEEKTT